MPEATPQVAVVIPCYRVRDKILGVIAAIPASVAQAAFRLQAGEITEPVVSPFGVHLVLVEERIPGQLSLEDARPQILEMFGKELWEQTAKQQRGKVKITRPKL